MIFTHCGKMGDLFQCLPIMSAWYKKHNDKVKLVLGNFPYNKECKPLLEMQECIDEVIYANYLPNMMAKDGIDWGLFKFNPHDYIEGFIDGPSKYINLGFKHFPNKNYTEFMAEDDNLDIDWDFKLDIGEKSNKFRGKCIVIDKYADNILRNHGIKGEYLQEKTSMIKNLQYAAGASAVKTTTTGSAVLLLMAGINCVIYGKEKPYGEYSIDMKALHMNLIYNKTPGKATWISI